MVENSSVYPLVCACCAEAVGTINEVEFKRMVAAGEVYICQGCLQAPPEKVEASLALSYPGEWEVMTELERQGITLESLAEDGRSTAG